MIARWYNATISPGTNTMFVSFYCVGRPYIRLLNSAINCNQLPFRMCSIQKTDANELPPIC